MRGASISEDTRSKIQELHAAGKSFQQIADELGVSWPTAKRYATGGKSSAGRARAGKAAGKADGLMLRVPADDNLCNEVWARLTLPEKVAALNSLEN